MKTIVIGGTGFIGSCVSKALIQSGRDVTVIGRRPPGPHTELLQCRYLCTDLKYRKQFREVLEPGCEVIDLAYSTVPKTSYGDPAFDLLSNLPRSIELLEESITSKVSRLMMISSGGTVYGNPQSLPLDEYHPTHPISPYGITKLTIEHYAYMFHRTRDLPIIVARPANAYGANQQTGRGQGFLAAAISAILSRSELEIYGSKGTIRDYINVEDVASGIVAALDFGEVGEIYNLGTGIGTSNLDIISLLKPLAESYGYLTHVKHLPPRRFDVEANVLDCQKLTSISGWEPQVSLQRGLAEMWHHALQRTPGSQDLHTELLTEQ